MDKNKDCTGQCRSCETRELCEDSCASCKSVPAETGKICWQCWEAINGE